MRDAFARERPPTATVYLFGSRTDLNAGSGDIDLLIHAPGISFEEKLAPGTRLNDALTARLGVRKIDIVTTPVSDATAKPFVRLALSGAVRLY